MRKFGVLVGLIGITLCLGLWAEKLPPRFEQWLDLVSPIITPTERSVFLDLRTDEDRDKFIQLFWSRRDPLPDTSDNEFYQEYMERVRYADRNFSHGSGRRGSLTERGFFYILLGPPIDRQVYATYSNLWPTELWYYRGEEKWGLPPYFYLVFYQPQGLGEFRLYNPTVEGPEKLIVPSMYIDELDRISAYQEIRRVAAELASASLSFLPGEGVPGMATLSTNSLIASLHSVPAKRFSDSYARAFLDFKDYVETDYTHNYIESRFAVKVFNYGIQPFLHWSLEPSKVNFGLYEDEYYASYQLIIRIEDLNEKVILEKEEEIPLNITTEQYQAHEGRIFALQDIIPVIPGRFRAFFLLKNKTGKEFTSFEVGFSAPEPGGGPALGGILLYHPQAKPPRLDPSQLRAFTFQGRQRLFNAQSNFLPREELAVYGQVNGLDRVEGKSVDMTIVSFDTETEVFSQDYTLSAVLGSDGQSLDLGPIPLSSIKPGYYRVDVSLAGPDGTIISRQSDNFVLTDQPIPVLPFVYAKLHKTFPSPEHLYVIAGQDFLSGRYSEALQELDKALRLAREPRFSLLRAQTLLALGRHEESLDAVLPLYEETKNREAAKIIAADYAGLQDWESALTYLGQLLEQAQEVPVLNLAAECLLKLNRAEEALPLLKRSLEIAPDQPDIRELKNAAERK